MASQASIDVDVAETIDEAPFNGFLILISLCLFFTLYFDGLDFGLLGYLIPVIAKDLAATPFEVGLSITVGPVGGALGGLIGGFYGDRLGRRNTLLASVALFSLATLALAFSSDMTMLILTRFLSTLGLGAATPNVAALLSELIPRRYRSQIMGAAFIGFPLGTATNGLLIPVLVPEYGWRSVAVAGAALPLMLLVFLLAILPESPRFLSNRRRNGPRIAKLLARIRPDLSFTGKENFVLREAMVGKAGVRALFAREYWRDTAGLWVLGFSNQFASISVASWGTTALTAIGFSYLAVVQGLMVSQLCGAAAALFGGWLMGRVGSRASLRIFSVFGIFAALAMFAYSSTLGSWEIDRNLLLVLGLAMLGLSLSGVQLGEYPLGANVYPTDIRASGVGWMVGVARVGAISAASVTGWIVHRFGPEYIFFCVALAFAVGWAALTLIRRHVPRAAARQSSS